MPLSVRSFFLQTLYKRRLNAAAVIRVPATEHGGVIDSRQSTVPGQRHRINLDTDNLDVEQKEKNRRNR